MIKRIHHIGIGVKNLDESVRFYTQTFGLKLTDTVSWPGLKAALLPAGDVILELIEPQEAKLPVAESLLRLVDQQGGGVHHLCLVVDDIEAEVESFKARGVRLMGDAPQQTAGGKIVWLDERVANRPMIELCEEGYQIKA